MQTFNDILSIIILFILSIVFNVYFTGIVVYILSALLISIHVYTGIHTIRGLMA